MTISFTSRSTASCWCIPVVLAQPGCVGEAEWWVPFRTGVVVPMGCIHECYICCVDVIFLKILSNAKFSQVNASSWQSLVAVTEQRPWAWVISKARRNLGERGDPCGWGTLPFANMACGLHSWPYALNLGAIPHHHAITMALLIAICDRAIYFQDLQQSYGISYSFSHVSIFQCMYAGCIQNHIELGIYNVAYILCGTFCLRIEN